LTLSESEQAQLSSIAASRSMPAALVRARIVLAAAAGHTNRAIADRYVLTQATGSKAR
jgi:hypothetical protein